MEKIAASAVHTFDVSLTGTYLLDAPEDPPFVAVALHGYGQTASLFASYARKILGPAPAIAAIQAPHPTYLEVAPGGRTGYHWGTSADWPGAIALHHRILLRVVADLADKPILLLGFSQPCGLNYRFLNAYPNRVQGAIALCGGVPKEWAPHPKLQTPILHIARDDDEFYPPESAVDFEARLKQYAIDVDFQLIPGKHRFPSDGRRLIQPWVQRVFGHHIGPIVPI